VRLRQLINNEWALGLSGALSILLGVLILAMPVAGLLALLSVVIGAYAVLFGALQLALAFRLRKLGQSASGRQPRPA
jgi:uncharacterized membrane protein HdeD (DUF308 family)